MSCDCEFDESCDEGDDYPSWHYKRRCLNCGDEWFGLHCPHDGIQNPCRSCGAMPDPETA